MDSLFSLSPSVLVRIYVCLRVRVVQGGDSGGSRTTALCCSAVHISHQASHYYRCSVKMRAREMFSVTTFKNQIKDERVK